MMQHCLFTVKATDNGSSRKWQNTVTAIKEASASVGGVGGTVGSPLVPGKRGCDKSEMNALNGIDAGQLSPSILLGLPVELDPPTASVFYRTKDCGEDDVLSLGNSPIGGGSSNGPDPNLRGYRVYHYPPNLSQPSYLQSPSTESFGVNALRHTLFSAALAVPLHTLEKALSSSKPSKLQSGKSSESRPQRLGFRSSTASCFSARQTGSGPRTQQRFRLPRRGMPPQRSFDVEVEHRRDELTQKWSEAGRCISASMLDVLLAVDHCERRRNGRRDTETSTPSVDDPGHLLDVLDPDDVRTGKGGARRPEEAPENEMEMIGNIINNNTPHGDSHLAYIDD